MILSIFSSGLFWFISLMLMINVGLIVILTKKYKSKNQKDDIPSTINIAGSNEFLEWLKSNLENKNFPSTYPDKEHLKSHIYELVMNQWRLQYVFQTGNAIMVNDISNVINEIIEFLIKKEKITFKKDIS